MPRRRRSALRRLRLAAACCAIDELDTLAIAHVDCDAFYATIEKRDDPSLAAEPVIVGGGKRGVVAACCYIARTYGVRSAMPMFEALRLCPQAKVVRPKWRNTASVGREVRQMMFALTPLVEPLSIDEAFLDLTGTERPARHVAGQGAGALCAPMSRSTSKSPSRSDCPAINSSPKSPPTSTSRAASPCSGVARRRPFSRQSRSASSYGVGKVSAARLRARRIWPHRRPAAPSEIELMRRYGEEGRRLARLARGIDAARSAPIARPKAFRRKRHSSATSPISVRWNASCGSLAEDVSARLKAKELAGATVTLKLKTADFKIRTRARSLDAPTQLARQIFAASRGLLEHETDGTRYRLLGVGVSALAAADQADPADLVDGRAAQAEHAVDSVRARFGEAAVVRGLAYEGPEKT